MRPVLALLLAAVLAVSACSPQQGRPSSREADRLAELLLPVIPGAYEPGPDAANGALDREQAAQSTLVPPGRLSSYLEDAGYRGGYGRVWLGPAGDYVTTLVFSFDQAAGATGVVALARSELEASVGALVESLREVPGGLAFVLTGKRRVKEDVVFCQGAWFAHGREAFTVTTCAPYPAGLDAAARLATRQFDRAQRT